MTAVLDPFWPQHVLDEVAAAGRQAALEAMARRDARMVAAEADRIAQDPMLLDAIPCLHAGSRPKTIIAVCEAFLEQPNSVGALRLRGALAYAQREIARATLQPAE